jgi:hypothetical protein
MREADECHRHCDATCTSGTRSKNLAVAIRTSKPNPVLITAACGLEQSASRAVTCHTEGYDVSKL